MQEEAGDSPRRRALSLERMGLENLRSSLGEFDKAIAETMDESLKGSLRAHKFQTERRLSNFFPWYSQAGQDRWIDEKLFGGQKNGVFVEVGAYDGITGSNTLFFERYRSWRGLLIEPSQHWAAIARSHRDVPCIEVAAGGSYGSSQFMQVTRGYTQMGGLLDSYDTKLREQVLSDPRYQGSEISVVVRPLSDVLREHGLRKINYISLDVEGAEFEVLSAFPFREFDIDVWSIENNTKRSDLGDIMRREGYRFALNIGVDEIWYSSQLGLPSDSS